MEEINKSLTEYLTNEEIAKLISGGKYDYYSSLNKCLQVPVESRRKVFIKLYDALNLDFKGKTVLDIGPGSGESLDVAKERGATALKFIDRDVIIGRYCENKGYEWINMDYIPVIIDQEIQMGKLADILITKGSFNFDFVQNEPTFMIDTLLDWFDIIADVKVFTPTWDKGELVEGHHHTCAGERYEKYLNSHVHKAFIDRGYKESFIEGYNDNKLRFPINYIKL